MGPNATLTFDTPVSLGAAFVPPAFQEQVIGSAAGPRGVAIADLDGDQDLDVAAAPSGQNNILWIENRGPSSLPFIFRQIPGAGIGGPRAVATGDFNGDKRADIAVAAFDSDTLAVFENGGGAPPTFVQRTITTQADGAAALAAADVDGDGDLDLVAASTNDDTISIHSNRGGNPALFAEQKVTTSAFGVSDVSVLDLNGDGDRSLDLLAVLADDHTIAWFRSTGVLQYQQLTINADAAGVTASGADLDGDGDLDVVGADTLQGGLAWYENLGSATPVWAKRPLTKGAAPAGLAAADLDADGDTDLLASFTSDDRVEWQENLGGTPPSFFARQADFGFGASDPRGLAIADLDADGHLDAIVGETGANSVVLARNRSGEPGTTTLAPGAVFDAVSVETENHRLVLNGGTLSAFTFENRGELRGFGVLASDVMNPGTAVFVADSEVVGDYDNSGSTTVQNGTLTVLGTLTNSGILIGDAAGAGGEFAGAGGGAGESGAFVEGTLMAGAGAALRFKSAGARLAVGGDFDVAIDDRARFDLAGGELRLAGLEDAVQVLEAMSADIGPDLASLDPLRPGHFPLGTLHVGPGATTAEVADRRDNDGAGQAVCEAVYAGTVRIAHGATLRNPTCKVYYRELELRGTVTHPENLVRLIDCPACLQSFRRGDVNDDGGLDISDAIRLLFDLFLEPRPQACPRAGDLDDNARLEVTDAILLLDYLFRDRAAPPPPFPDCGRDPTPDELPCPLPASCRG